MNHCKTMFGLVGVLLLLALTGCPPAEGFNQGPTPRWERFPYVSRTRTPDGWLIRDSHGMVYIPDSKHAWLEKPPQDKNPGGK